MANRIASRRNLRNWLSNWNQPMPLRKKVAKTVRNLSIRVIKAQTCCGHEGEPGC